MRWIVPIMFPLLATAQTTINISNAGFEHELVAWINTADNGMSKPDPEAAHSGRLGLRVTDKDGAKSSGLASARFDAVGGRDYQLKCWARNLSGAGMMVCLRFYDANGTLLTTREKGNEIVARLFPVNTDWTELSCAGRAPPDSVKGEIWLQSSVAGLVVADFDDFSLTMTEAKAAEPSTVSPPAPAAKETVPPSQTAPPSAAAVAAPDAKAEIPPAPPTSGGGLLANGGFENDKNGWELLVSSQQEGKGCRFEIVKEDARTGKNCAVIESTTHADNAIVNWQTVNPGQRYRLIAWVRGDARTQVRPGTPGAMVRIIFWDEKRFQLPNPVLVKPSTGPLSSQWTKLETVFEAPTGACFASIALFAHTVSGRLYWDDVQLESLHPPGAVATTETEAIQPAASDRPIPRSTLANGGFENGLDDWVTTADNEMSKPSPEAAHSGKLGLRVADKDETKSSGLASARFQAMGGQRYTLCCWARNLSGAGMMVYLRFYDANGTLLTTRSRGNEIFTRLFPVNTEWTELSCSGTAPPGATQGEIWLESSVHGTVTADFDDFTLTVASGATTAAPPTDTAVRTASASRLNNGGFENGKTDWYFWIPPEHRNKKCRFDIVNQGARSGQNCAIVQSEAMANCALSYRVTANPGERYRASAWVHADETTQLQAGTPGAMLRITSWKDSKNQLPGNFQVSFSGKIADAKHISLIANQSLPTEWTKIEAVFEVPPGTTSITVSLFNYFISGKLYWDDAELVPVGPEVPLTPSVTP